MIRPLLAWLRWIVPLAAAFFIARVIWLQWQKVHEIDWTFDPLYLGLALVAGSSWFLVRPYIWQALVRHSGFRVPYWQSARIFAISELSRYVPGKIWQHASRVYLAARWGVPAPIALTSALMDLALMALAAVPLALLRLGEVFPVLGGMQRFLLFVFPLAAGLILHPVFWNRLGKVLLPRLKMEFIPVRLTAWQIGGLLATCLFLWAMFTTGFVFFARSLVPIPFSRAVGVASSYALAWLVGMVAPFAPGGLIVREGILGLLLGKILPLPAALLIAILSRLWIVALELSWAAVMQAYSRVAPPAEPEGRR